MEDEYLLVQIRCLFSRTSPLSKLIKPVKIGAMKTKMQHKGIQYPEDFTKIRRKERSKDDAWIKAFLARAEFGTMATADGDQPFLVTRNFVYDEKAHAIYMHGAKKGRTYESASLGPKVCFSASEAGRLLPAKKAMNLGTEFGGVVIFGHLHVVDNIDEARHGLQLLCDKYFPHLKPDVDYETTTETDLIVTAVLRIDINSWSGKEKIAPDDFPGAFYFKDISA